MMTNENISHRHQFDHIIKTNFEPEIIVNCYHNNLIGEFDKAELCTKLLIILAMTRPATILQVGHPFA